MIDDTVILYGKTKLPADDCKVVFKDKFKKEHTVEISRLIQVFNYKKSQNMSRPYKGTWGKKKNV